MMDLPSLLAEIDAPALDSMSRALETRAAMLAREDHPESRAWSRLYGFLSVEMESAAVRRLTGVSL